MTNPCQDPTQLQEACHAWEQDRAALVEQIVEAYRLLKAAHLIVYTKGETEDDTGLLIDMDCFFDQNEALARGETER